MTAPAESILYEPICIKHNELTQIAKWRNAQMECLRTPTPTPETFEAQAAWVNSLDINRDRYYFIYRSMELIGYCGITNIIKPYRTGEISLLFNPAVENRVLYHTVLKSLLCMAIDIINLNCVRVEVYECAKRRLKWIKCANSLFPYWVELPAQKMCDGEYYSSHIGLFYKKLKRDRRIHDLAGK